MTSFTSLLSSIGGGPPSAPKPISSNPAKPSAAAPGASRPQALANGAKPTTSNVAAGVKRKPEEQAVAPRPKVVKTEINVPVRPPGQSQNQAPTTAKPALSAGAPATAFRGTARPAAAGNVTRPTPKPVVKPVAAAANTSTTSTLSPATPDGSAKPKRGFASLLEKAKAAQEAAKAAGTSTIKHKPVEKLSKRERQRMQEAAAKQKVGGKAGKVAANDRSRSGTPVDAKAALQKKVPEAAYKGTMRKQVERQESAYKGTMGKAIPAGSSAKSAAKKNIGQDKYGGYADWDDLSNAEDEEEEYESDASSDMMEAGWDDVEQEEGMALKAARKEDQEALAEEERHKREKLERKKKLMALSKSAAARKKF